MVGARGFEPPTSCSQSKHSTRLGDAGRILIRPSGTEPLLRVMVEAREAALAQHTAQRVADAVRSVA